MKIKPFGINGTSIGYKKIGMLFGSFLFACVLSFLFPLPLQVKIAGVSVYAVIFFILIYLGVTRGITVIQKRIFILGRERLLVRDRLFPTRPEKSFRDVCPSTHTATYSSLYFKNSDEWAFLDCIRKIIAENQPTTRSAAVLGGAGAAIPLGLLENFQIPSDVVEISPVLVGVAKQYFLPLREKKLGKKLKEIRLIQDDAIRFVLKNKESYGLAIVDLFNEEVLIPEVKNKAFIKKLVKTSEYVIVNFGLRGTTMQLHQFFEGYIKFFRYSNICFCQENYIGIFSNKKKIKTLTALQRIY